MSTRPLISEVSATKHLRVTTNESKRDVGSQRSTVEFPYVDLDNAIVVTRTVAEIDIGGCAFDALAGRFGVSPGSARFRMRIACARTFGLVSYVRSGPIRLTDLGRKILDPKHKAEAKAKAFLCVPLYECVYARFRDAPLPRPTTLEHVLISLGVGRKVAVQARRVLLKSARQAGYLEKIPDCLTSPLAADPGSTIQAGGDDLHPLIQGLVSMLPNHGVEWPISERIKWLHAANSIFGMVYRCTEDAGIAITIQRLG